MDRHVAKPIHMAHQLTPAELAVAQERERQRTASQATRELKSELERLRTLVERDEQAGGPGILHESDLRRLMPLALRKGVDVNAADGNGNTALMWIALLGSAEDMRLLFEHGAKVNLKTRWGTTALMLSGDNLEKAQILLANGADINAKQAGLTGDTALTKAVRYYYMADNIQVRRQFVRLLVEHGADVNAIGSMGNTPLMEASVWQDDGLLELLLDHGAQVNKRNILNGWTALMAAANIGRVDNVRLLIKRGADVDAKANDGTTALNRATGEVRQILLEAGATNS